MIKTTRLLHIRNSQDWDASSLGNYGTTSQVSINVIILSVINREAECVKDFFYTLILYALKNSNLRNCLIKSQCYIQMKWYVYKFLV